MREVLLVAIGAVPGAWLRFRLVNHLEPMLPRKHWGTFTVNVIASFALGLVAALVNHCGPDQRLGLLLGIGFLGSLSTFSTFSVELLQTLRSGLFKETALLAVGSVFVGVVAVLAGMATVG